ncbi:JAB domain-containing protein [Sphingomonas sp. MMS24-J45]|uniref:JAB domain-containing protein n=1 Tax=Sphingomonas sp. MMS24-J45 TaxID=3238806 RepID=UPI0038506A07
MEQSRLRLPLGDLATLEGEPMRATIGLFEPIATVREEVAVFAYLGPQGKLLGARHVGSGLSDAVPISVREVMADVFAFDCTGVVMAHNHPSGDPTPSETDYAFTRRFAHALDAIGVRLYDHLVLAREGCESFRRRGLL